MAAFIFPGQGSQQAGAAALFQDSCEEAHAVFETAARILPAEDLQVILAGGQEELSQTRYAQPALLCTETAAAALLNTLGVRPGLCSGHSLGEISALVVSGALELETALKLVRERARLMSENVPPGGMSAVLGLRAEEIECVLPDTVQIANFNGPAQTIISGSRDGLEGAAVRLKEAGAKRILPLAVSGPFHSRYMEAAGNALARYLEQVPLVSPAVPFLSSVSGQLEDAPERIRQLLAEQLCRPVLWTTVMEKMNGMAALEVGPGSVLQGLAKRMPGGPVVHAASTPEHCRELAATLE